MIRGQNVTASVSDVLRALDEKAPQATAEEWDHVGLILGDADQQTLGAIVSIDLTFEAVQLAIRKQYGLIINHHPCLFPKKRALSRILSGTPVYAALRHGIAVAAYHTNFDRSALEVIPQISQALGIQPKGRLFENHPVILVKLVTFVPITHVDAVREAICQAGAGHIGNYDACTFSVEGEGTFRGGAHSRPFIGSPGQLERVREVRLETVVPQAIEHRVVQALLKAHPYEEVAYDLFPIQPVMKVNSMVRGLGYGFWGEFPSPRAFPDLAKDVKSLFNIHGFWITDPVPTSVARVGFVAGQGASFVEASARLKCDLLITGEASYHTALDGARRGVAIMELGHRESEKFFMETMKSWLSELNIEFVAVQTPTQKLWQEE